MQASGTHFSTACPAPRRALLGALSSAANAHAWGLESVATLADQGAEATFQSTSRPVAAEPASLDADEYRDSRFDSHAQLWRQATQPVELRAFLQLNSHAVSETWTNLITP